MDVASTSLTQLSVRLSDLPLGFVSTTVGDTVGTVVSLVNSVVGAVGNLLHDLLDPILGPIVGCKGLGGVLGGGVRQCRVNKVQNEILDGDNLTGISRSEEHTSELQSLMRISYAVFCLKKKKKKYHNKHRD